MPLIKLIPQLILTIIAIPFVALYAWICMPSEILDTMAEHIRKKDYSAYYLYYAGLSLATYGFITIIHKIYTS